MFAGTVWCQLEHATLKQLKVGEGLQLPISEPVGGHVQGALGIGLLRGKKALTSCDSFMGGLVGTSEPQARQGSTEANPVCSLVALQQGLVQSWILPKITKLELSRLVNQELLEPE